MTDRLEDFEERIRVWLEKSGRALELRVARQFHRSKAEVMPSMGYTDVITGKLREADAVAKFTWTGHDSVPCGLMMALECKSGKDKPWIAFLPDDETTVVASLEEFVVFAHGPFVGLTEPLEELWIGKPPFTQEPVATHVVTGLSGDDRDGSRNPANDAVRQALSLGLALRELYIQRQGRERRAAVIIAVVVTTAPLITCRLGSAGEIELERVETQSVWGYTPAGDRRRVYVVTEDALASFVRDLKQRAENAGVSAAERC